MLSPSKPRHAAGEEVHVAPSSSLEETVAHVGPPLPRKLTLKILPVRRSATRYGSRLCTGPIVGETSCQCENDASERKTLGVSGAPSGVPVRSCHSWKTMRP